MIASLSAVLVSGLVLGSLYALMAVGLSLVWSTLGIFNFANGVFMTIGAYVAWTVGDAAGLGFGLAAGVAVAIAALAGLGCLVERALIRPFIGRDDVVLVAVITTLAAMTFLENATLLAWGPRYKQLPPWLPGTVNLFGTTISAHEALIIVIAPVVLGALWLGLKYTRIGAAIRAVGQNGEAALLIGIDVPLLYSLAFTASAILAGLAGILLASIRLMTPSLGSEPLVKALVVVIFGGLGSLAGTIGGAYVIGLLEATSIYLVGLYWTPTVLFVIMIGTLIARPNGLFGRN